MSSDLIIIYTGIALAIIIVAIAAYFLQQWLILRRFPPRIYTSGQGEAPAEIMYFEEKLEANYGNELPTTKIRRLLSIPNSADKIILLDDKKPFQNLLRCHSNGWIVWRGQLPTDTGDAYTFVEWHDHELKAFSISCYLATLDPEKGEIISYEFAKEPFRLG